MLTQEQYLALQQRTRKIHIRLEVLNNLDQVIDALEGVAIDGAISMSADSTYRRTGNLTMILDKKYNLLPSPNSRLWLDKRVAVYVGIEGFSDIQWFPLGRFALSNIQAEKTVATQTISCDLLDYMAFLDGTLGGTLESAILIPAESVTISQAIASSLADLPKKAIDIVEINAQPAKVPYDIEKPAGSTTYEVIKELAELYKNYEFYFDLNGYFRFAEIKKRINDPIVWDFSATPLSLNDKAEFNLQNVKNSVWLWGKIWDTGNGSFQATWKYRNRFSRPTALARNAIVSKEVGDICYVEDSRTSFFWNGSNWQLLDFNVEPAFNIENIGEKIAVVNGDNVYTTDQAILNTKFALLGYNNLGQTVSFDTVPIYSLQPNNKIYLKSEDLDIEGEYLIKSISFPLGLGSSNIQCEKIYY
jgi:hypothetical protein